MSEGSGTGTPAKGRRGKALSREEIRAQVQATRADFERQVQARKAQLDATSEKIEQRAGRNLILAILIGLAVGGLVVVSLIFIKELFLVFGVAMAGFAAFELTQALRSAGRRVARIPTVIGAVAILPASFLLHAGGQLVSLAAGVALVIVCRLVEEAFAGAARRGGGELVRDLTWSVFVQMYVSLLASYSILLLAQEHGEWWVLGFVIVVVAVDTGAYVSGLSWGRHPMAPTISPKKTWEGFAGAGVTAVAAGILVSVFMLGQTWWFGIVFGLAMLLTATAGDLAESLVKRDLGIKDMSSWLPGHGGFLDRLDSILPSAAAAYGLFLIFS
ncbi:phosphatidate cytidylyltransferase [Leifsonia xyli subsp. cynodontis DSM 46306]|jgi:phosphatidate cytidylyltransferase|uniref:Phosphatidate cytidylyltransferase n=1 Tax=Leifsonia xyli subsp. cynodontis DSM 46306 TaxID=1389489 RepID=U3P5T4_LEIXC|nr:phosphatidate cytidylyltransferase [Leifsonia xyli]AGW41156.1 phosphatidate cytidylyltransferase [Leifsonia xyli subsp. cynodontis DSM 46306]